MPDPTQNSQYNQVSFSGGMDLLLDDTHLSSNKYRIGFNLRNRYDRLDLIKSSQEDKSVPFGIIQEMITFGNYEIVFVSGKAYYKLYTDTGWTKIDGFQMSVDAPRYWTEAIPVAITNYLRIAATNTVGGVDFPSASSPVNLNNVAGAAAGNLPGLVVQDNINQPQFIFLDAGGRPTVRTTQKFEEWSITFTNADNVDIAPNGDKREYVPIGNSMAWVDGVLWVVSPDFTKLLRSVSGRPLDFVVNVTNLLADAAPFTMVGGGDAYTTAYSVGVGGITCIRGLSDDSLFVAASNANFSVFKNMSNIAPKEFGEFTYIRKFLFNAVCLSDRAIFDTLGDTRFITLTGVRSFNAIQQSNNEGRNLPFTNTIRPAFGTDENQIIQNPNFSACILYNDYELYAVNTVFGPAIAVYDTINSCWCSFDINQTNGQRIKKLVKIELTAQALFAITEDNKLFRLYIGPDPDEGKLRSVGICAGLVSGSENIKIANPEIEIQPRMVRTIVNNITKDCEVGMTLYVNNRLSVEKMTKDITYTPPKIPVTDKAILTDVDSMLKNILWSTPSADQGWKAFVELSWTNGSITQLNVKMAEISPMQPIKSQP